jgi:O-antigen/teichoic acid export membrane protein
MGHENYDRDEKIDGSSNRSFGLVFAAFFGLVGLLPLILGRAPRIWAFLPGALFLLAALFFPSVLGPLNRAWMRLGLLLHRVVSPIVLGIMFYLVITPMGLLMRAMGKDFLRLRPDPAAASYWIDRRPPGPAPEAFKDQF